MFWVCEPMLCLQAPCHCCLQRNINALNEVLDSQPPFPCIHDLTKDSLDCLLTKRCKLKATGNSPILAAETCIAFKRHGETTCCARLVHPIRWGVMKSFFNRTSTPRPSVGAGTTCNAIILWPNLWRGLCQIWSLPKLYYKYMICVLYCVIK